MSQTLNCYVDRIFDYQTNFFNPSPADTSPKQFVQYLKSYFVSVRPVAISYHLKRMIFVPPHMNECSHVLVRLNGLRKLLPIAYDEPHTILNSRDINFDLEINRNKETVPIERLKPDFIAMDNSFIFPQYANTPPGMRKKSASR